jgi:hypothetical protein
MILLADAVRESTGAGVIHFRKLQGTVGAEALANALTPFVESGGIVPLSLFDPEAAGYRGKPGSAQVLVTGASREEVLAVEAGIEAAIA